MSSSILLLFDVFGTFVFALSGAAKAISKKMDFLGVIVFAITVGCAGGMIRDVLIGAVPVAVYQNSVYIVVAFVAGLLMFLIAENCNVDTFPSHIMFFDAVGLGFFTAMGCEKAASFGIIPVGIVFSGWCTKRYFCKRSTNGLYFRFLCFRFNSWSTLVPSSLLHRVSIFYQSLGDCTLYHRGKSLRL